MYPTKLRDELLATIKKKGLDILVYCPMVKSSEARKGLIKSVARPLFFNYMFWYYDLDLLPYDTMSQYMKFRLLRFPNKEKHMVPQHLTPKEISRIKKSVSSHNSQFDRLRTDISTLRKYIGWKVVVRDGAFTGMVGKVSDVRKTGMLDVELSVFNRPISCEMSVEYVEFVR